jgi:Family of unknown function (DUF5681)
MMENSKKRGPGRPFRKGQTGNPKGRPKNKTSLTALLREEIHKTCPEDRQNRSYEELIVLATMRLAMKGNATALALVWERMDGKLPLAVRETASGPIHLNVRYVDSPVQNPRTSDDKRPEPDEEGGA